MKDKFKLNFYLTLVPAILTIILLIIFGKPEVTVATHAHALTCLKYCRIW